MKRKITFLLAALLLSCGLSWAQTTETLNIANYASANNWENSNQYLTATVGDVTFTATGGSNTGKYYSNDQSWRFYANENATLTITVPSGSTLVSVTPTFTIKDNGTLVYDGSTITSGSSVNVNGESAMFSISQSSGNKGKVFFTEIEVTYTSGATPTVAMPTFNPASGTEFGDEGLQVFITCATEGVDIYYTLDGSEPDDESISYSGPISLTETTTIKAIAYDGDENNSAVATATYTYVDPNAPGTENNPYTVAQARAAIDANVGTQGVYATGIVSAIPTAWSTQYNNITFNFVDNTGDTEFLQAYRCVSGTGVDASDVAVGDVVVVYGNLTKYQSTYEFAQNCTLVSLTHPTGYVEAPTFSPAAGTYDEAQNVTINCANANATIYYTLDGTEPTNASTPYTAAINIATTTTIKAVAYVGANASAVSTAEYAIVPVANISSITEVNTSYVVKGTVVATNSRGFIMGDGTGYVYYYNNGAVSQSVGDMVKVSGTTGTYGQIIQFTNTATVTEATTSNYNGTPAATVITEVPDYSEGYHLSTYFEFEGELTKTSGNYLIAVGESQIQISYPTTGQGTELTALSGKTVHVKGYFSGINSSSKFTVMLESAEEVVSTDPVITLDTYEVDVPAEGAEGILNATYHNMEGYEIGGYFDIYFYAEDGVTHASYDWITAELDADNNVHYVVQVNDGAARTAYFKVGDGFDPFGGDPLDGGGTAYAVGIYSDLVTVYQEAYVAPTYAELPFEFNGGRADIENTDGLYQEGLGTDYNATTAPNTKLKFDGTGDWLLLQFNEEPGTLTFDIKGNGFNGGTFTVQTSEDGETYTDLAIYEVLGDTETKTFSELNENIRYIKWVYTQKATGNVGLGNIHLYEPGVGPVPETYDLTVEPFENLEIFTFVENENEAALEGAGTIQVTEGDQVMLSITANEGYVIQSLMVDGVEHVNDIDNEATYTFTMPNHNVTVSATAVEDVPFEPATYTLVTSYDQLVDGKTYIIVGSKEIEGETYYYAMGEQRNNNRGGVAISVDGTTATVETADVHEFIINETLLLGDLDFKNRDGGISDNIWYSFYDTNEASQGYLYAASSTANQLKTETELENNGIWDISIDENGQFSVVAQGSNTRNVMQFNYNGGSTLFNCYSSASQLPVYLYVKEEATTTVTQTITLAAGTNWFSTYVEITLDDLKAALVEALPGTSGMSIASKTQTTTYNGSRWRGGLNTLDVAYMYKITVPAACEISLTGMAIDPAEHPITIPAGEIVWIGFPFAENMTPADAFAGFAVSGDQVSAKTQSTTYNGTRWRGGLTSLVPGQGYTYKSGATVERVLTFPSAK